MTRRVALSRVLSVFLVASTTASCLLLQRSGLVDLALGRISVAIIGLLWFMSTFTQVRRSFRGDIYSAEYVTQPAVIVRLVS